MQDRALLFTSYYLFRRYVAGKRTVKAIRSRHITKAPFEGSTTHLRYTNNLPVTHRQPSGTTHLQSLP
jgi:hypothetical protein